jgi:hypothetical protein
MEEIDRELIEPLGQAVASLLLLEEDAATIVASLGINTKAAARKALRTGYTALLHAQEKLRNEPVTGRVEAARDKAVVAIGVAKGGLLDGQNEYREALWSTDELTRVGLEELGDRLSEHRLTIAAAQSAVNQFLALQGSEQGQPG